MSTGVRIVAGIGNRFVGALKNSGVRCPSVYDSPYFFSRFYSLKEKKLPGQVTSWLLCRLLCCMSVCFSIVELGNGDHNFDYVCV